MSTGADAASPRGASPRGASPRGASPRGPDAQASPTWQPVDEQSYRTALRRLASGVTVVTTRHGDVDHAMTASAVTSVSLRPPLVLVCVEKVARFHGAVLATGVWGVSILSADAARVASHLAHRGRPIHGQLDGADVHRGRTGVPLLGRSLAWLECRTWAVYDGGDHSIVVGEVVEARIRGEGGGPADEGQSGTGTSTSVSPLVYVNAAYHTVRRLGDLGD